MRANLSRQTNQIAKWLPRIKCRKNGLEMKKEMCSVLHANWILNGIRIIVAYDGIATLFITVFTFSCSTIFHFYINFFSPNAWVFAFCCLCVLYFYLTWSKYKVNQRKRNITMKRWECTAHASVESTWTNGKTNQSISYSLINHSKATAFVRGPAFTMMRSRSRSHPHSHHRQKVL